MDYLSSTQTKFISRELENILYDSIMLPLTLKKMLLTEASVYPARDKPGFGYTEASVYPARDKPGFGYTEASVYPARDKPGFGYTEASVYPARDKPGFG